jgi:hypothetical protein
MKSYQNWSSRVKYDEESKTGLVWANDSHKVSVGDACGWKTSYGYWYTRIFSRNKVMAHRVIYELVYNCSILPGYFIDHIDGDGLNNKIENLHLVTKRSNSQNQKFRSNNTSGVTGVSYDKSKNSWVAKWNNIYGKPCKKDFSTGKEKNAFELACFVREEAVALLNMRGMCYTKRHSGGQ